MATTISTQDIIDAKRDIDDIGKAVNEKVIVTPRYGEDFKSLPMISAEFQISSDAAEAAAVSAAESANIAQSSSQIAQDSAALAELAATAATIGGKVYDTPASGVDPVTGVADGAYFNVRSASDESYVDEYQNVGGSAVATGKQYLSAVGVQQQEKPASTIKDASGKSQQDINNAFIGVNTIADLLAIVSPFNGMRVNVKGYHAPTLFVEANPYKGGGTFVWDATSTATANNGTVFAVNGVATGRWIRQLAGSEFITPQMFGAKATGLAADDDYPAIMSAINSLDVLNTKYGNSGPTVFFPLGSYYSSQTINLKSCVRLLGESSGLAGASSIINFAQGCDGIIVNGQRTFGPTGESDYRRGYSAEGSSIEGLTLTQSGYNRTSLPVLDYNANLGRFISYNFRSLIAEGTTVVVRDDRLDITFEATMGTRIPIGASSVLVPDTPVLIPVGETITGQTSGATGVIEYIGTSVLSVVISGLTGAFVVGESVTYSGGTFKVASMGSNGPFSVFTLTNASGITTYGDVISKKIDYGSGIQLRGRASIKNVRIQDFPNFGLLLATDGNQPGNVNLSSIDTVICTGIGMHGLLAIGGDSNACKITGLSTVSCSGYGIKDRSFLGNHYFSCHTSLCGIGAYYSSQNNNFSVFVGCYSEGGARLYPYQNSTSRFGRNSTVIGGDHGSGIASSLPGLFPTNFNGNQFSLGRALYVTGQLTAGNLLNRGFSFRTESTTETISLVNSGNGSAGTGAAVGFYCGLGSGLFSSINDDVMKTGQVGVVWSMNNRKGSLLAVDLLPDHARTSNIALQTPQPSGSQPPIFSGVITNGVVTGVKMYSAGYGLNDGELIMTGSGDYNGVTITAQVLGGSVVSYTMTNSGVITDAVPRTLIRALNISTTSVLSGSDNVMALGSAGNRWSQVYAGTGTINTSDEREKQQIRDLSEAEKRVAIKLKSQIKAFKFNDAVAEKGDKARIHFGVIAQEVKAAFESEGLVAEDYAVLCYDEWDAEYREITEEITVTNDAGEEVAEMIETGERELIREAGNRYGVRYEELLAFIISTL